MPERRTVLFLYTRLPDYFYQCIGHFVTAYPCQVTIVRYAGDVNTRYSFTPHPAITLVDKDAIDLGPFMAALDPSAIFLSGWSDRQYTAAAKPYARKIPVILALDNPWLGTLKQKTLAAFSALLIHSFSNRVWVPGRAQYEYARHLGFASKDIYNELYCADTGKFYSSRPDLPEGRPDAPRQMVYVGRLVEYKKPDLLAEVFNELVGGGKYPWKLVIAGEGPLKENIRNRQYQHVELRDFLDPADLPAFYRHAAVFCLPSKHEHWGVAVQEAAAAGLPLLLSDTVEAGSAFLIDGYNGFSFSTGNKEGLRKAMKRFFDLSPKELEILGRNSITLSKRINHDSWSAILNRMVTR